MSDLVRVVPRSAIEGPIEVSGLTPDRCAVLAETEIASLPVWLGRREAALGDFFTVTGGHRARLVVEGDVGRVSGIGAGMAGGDLVIAGSAGARVGAAMSGGTVVVRGSVADEAGAAMSGGVLRVWGSAGDRLAAALPGASKGMTGGEVVVSGSAGRETGGRARRGLIVVGGDAGEDAARDIIAGTVVVIGRTGPGAGRGSKRGSVVAVGGIDVPATYRYACTYEPGYVRLLMTYLRRTYGLPIGDDVLAASYRRYCGDAGDPGKGEILARVLTG